MRMIGRMRSGPGRYLQGLRFIICELSGDEFIDLA
jgi:hypothetical protein